MAVAAARMVPVLQSGDIPVFPPLFARWSLRILANKGGIQNKSKTPPKIGPAGQMVQNKGEDT